MSSKENKHKGNTMQEQAAFDRMLWSDGMKLNEWDRQIERYVENDQFIRNMTVKAPDMLKSEWMIIIRMENHEGHFVAFQGGATFREAFIGIYNRLANGSIVWKEDKYAGR